MSSTQWWSNAGWWMQYNCFNLISFQYIHAWYQRLYSNNNWDQWSFLNLSCKLILITHLDSIRLSSSRAIRCPFKASNWWVSLCYHICWSELFNVSNSNLLSTRLTFLILQSRYLNAYLPCIVTWNCHEWKFIVLLIHEPFPRVKQTK